MFASSLTASGASEDVPRPIMSSLAEALRRCAASSDSEEDGYDRAGREHVFDRVDTLIVVDRHCLSRAAMEAFFRATQTDRTVVALDRMEQLAELPDLPECENPVVLLCIGSHAVTDPIVREDLAQIRSRLSRAPVMVLGDLCDEKQVSAAMEAGVNAYVPTSVSPEVVTRLIDVVRYGCIFIPSPLTRLSAPKPRRIGALPERAPSHPAQPRQCDLPVFTPRELQVLRCLRTGMQNKTIAYRLNLQESTVKVHIRNILKKLDVRTRTQAALLAHGVGLDDAVAPPGEAGIGEAGRNAFARRPSRPNSNGLDMNGSREA